MAEEDEMTVEMPCAQCKRATWHMRVNGGAALMCVECAKRAAERRESHARPHAPDPRIPRMMSYCAVCGGGVAHVLFADGVYRCGNCAERNAVGAARARFGNAVYVIGVVVICLVLSWFMYEFQANQ